MSQDASGNPQKAAPCGDEAGGTPSNIVTTFAPGETITVTIKEGVFHPGHYRIALSTNSRSELPADPVVTAGSTACGSAEIDPSPSFPVLADGVLVHASAFSGPQSVQVTLPSDVTCTNCTLQVIEFMSNHQLNNPGGCFYHHCADIAIVPAGTGGTSGTGGGTTGTGGTTMMATGGTSANATGGTTAMATGGSVSMSIGGTTVEITGGAPAFGTGGTTILGTGGAATIGTGGTNATSNAGKTGGTNSAQTGGASQAMSSVASSGGATSSTSIDVTGGQATDVASGEDGQANGCSCATPGMAGRSSWLPFALGIPFAVLRRRARKSKPGRLSAWDR